MFSKYLAYLVLGLSGASVASSQVVYAPAASSPGIADSTYLPSAPYPLGQASPLGFMPLFNYASVATPGSGVDGGQGINQRNGWVYTSDGFWLAVDSHFQYPPALGGPVPLPVPIFGAVVPGQPVTGVGFDSAGGRLVLCSQTAFSFHLPTPPYTTIAGPFPVPVSAASGPLSGIGWDPLTATVYMCTLNGHIFNYSNLGAPVGVQPISIMPATLAMFPGFTGLDINTSNGAGTFPPPTCSGQAFNGFHVCVTDGLHIWDAINIPLAPIPTASAFRVVGLSFSSDLQFVIPSASPFNFAWTDMTRPAHVGPGIVPSRIRLVNAPPLQSAWWVWDVCGGIVSFAVPWGGSLLLNPGTLNVYPTATNGSGVADVTIPPWLPPGLQISGHWVYGDPGAPPFLISHTDMAEITLGAQ